MDLSCPSSIAQNGSRIVIGVGDIFMDIFFLCPFLYDHSVLICPMSQNE